ncbi:UNVERIFIED_CONTAM: GDSL esterase/lipase [Sesamum radiatum]|uniref:GDSL esterase/lipase n=1 Tax=Sesamum radiatum TaxID=300843 RepID=A0AAW2LCD9_SESRA
MVSSVVVVHGDPLVPALLLFGDSVVDVGNNNNLQTLVKANFLPYGRDFNTHRPTGRFSNGKLATDFTAEYLGFTSYQPAYLSQEARGRNILTGVNFASAASGYYEPTAQLYGALTLARQLEYYRDWQRKVVSMVGREKANAIFSGGIHLISAGTSDFIQNYYINPLLRVYSPDQFSDILMRSYSTLIQNLYSIGARRIGVTALPPTGCLPAAITLFGSGSNQCVARLNQDAVSFNNKLNTTSQYLKTKLPGLKLVVFDIYQPLLDMITKPSDSGMLKVFTRSQDDLTLLHEHMTILSALNSTQGKYLTKGNKMRIHTPNAPKEVSASHSLLLIVIQMYLTDFILISRILRIKKSLLWTGIIETSFLCNTRSVGTCSNATEYVFWDGFHPSEAANEKLAQDLLEQGFDLIS